MKVQDIIHARGMVSPSFLNLATGEREPWERRHNTLSYAACEAMAAAFGGDKRFVPNHIGIIYGDSSQFIQEGDLRDQRWSALKESLREANADVQIRSFSCTPTLGRMEPDDRYDVIPGGGNCVTFHMHSDSSTPGSANPGSGNIFVTGKYIYQAVLLSEVGGDFYVIARASLEGKSSSSSGGSDGSSDPGARYYPKPENFEVALDWTVKFF